MSTVNSAMQQALSRLSTGYKINNASDDAAGLVISTALNVQTRGLNVANQNAQMAVNVLSVADSGLSALSDLTMRIRDLATQAANGVYSLSERSALALEATELSKSMTQIIDGTKFNEFKVFEGTAKGIITEEEAIAQGYTVIKTASELQNITNMSGKYILMNNIDLSSTSNFSAIGTSSVAFTGTFDGNGYTISNLKIDKTTDNQGLFGYTSNATIKNVALENVDVKGGICTGGLAGNAGSSIITNCSVSGSVTGTDSTGGLVGNASSTISNCYATGNVTGNNYTGGLVGWVGGATISNSYATGNVTGAGFDTGGLVGSANYNTTISNCYATGNVTGNDYTGGLVGGAWSGSTTSSYATGNVTGEYATGGFVGHNDSTSSGNSFIRQTSGIGAVGIGSATGITEQNSSYFTPALIQSTLSADVGAGQWDFSGLTPRLKWQVGSADPLTFQIGTEGNKLSTLTVNAAFSLNGFSVDLSTADSARTTMQRCDTLLKQINTKRGEIGASSNIITSIVEGNDVTNENLSASKSRIMDADVAKESANMVKNQILENTATALLLQSKNFDGGLVLQLLGALR